MRKAPDVNCPAVLELLMKSNPIACCLTALMSLLCICWYAINTWHKVVAIDGLPTHVHRPYVLSCFCVSTQEKNRARIPASFTCTRITYAPGLMIEKYHRWGKSPLPQRWKPGHSIGRMLTQVVFGADFSTEHLPLRFPHGSAEVERLEHFASSNVQPGRVEHWRVNPGGSGELPVGQVWTWAAIQGLNQLKDLVRRGKVQIPGQRRDGSSVCRATTLASCSGGTGTSRRD